MLQDTYYKEWDFTNTWIINNGKTMPRLRALTNLPIVLNNISILAKEGDSFSDTISIIPMDTEIKSIAHGNSVKGMTITQDTILNWEPDTTGSFVHTFVITDNNDKEIVTNLDITAVSFKGMGTESSPFEIETVDDLFATRYALSSNFIMKNDLDLTDSKYTNNEGWHPIGTPGCPFTGKFNGKGYKITGLYINRLDKFQGLFGSCLNSKIDSLHLLNLDITADQYIGGMVGFSTNSEFSHCSVFGKISSVEYIGGLIGKSEYTNISSCNTNVGIESSYYRVGGLVGTFLYGTIINSSTTGDITAIGEDYVGGLTGESKFSRIIGCYTTGDVFVSTSGYYAGGLSGYVYNSQVKNCYAVGNVTGKGNCGGLIGVFSGEEEDSVINCYSAGVTSGTSRTGAFIGQLAGPSVKNCYYNNSLPDQASSDIGYSTETYTPVTGLTTTQMKQKASFESWDFDNEWAIRSDSTYPVIQNINNAPFAYADTVKGSWSNLMNKNIDYETLQNNLVYDFESVVKYLSSNTTSIISVDEVKPNDSLRVEYRIGEYNANIGDTIWGNRTTSYLVYQGHAPVITSTAGTSVTAGETYTYTVTATDEDGDVLTYKLSNEPAGMTISGTEITWTPANGVTTSGEVTLTVSDGILTDTEKFTVVVDKPSYIENKKENKLLLYPNPIKSGLNISGKETIDHIEIISATGALVYHEMVSSPQVYINLEFLQRGVYYVHIITEKQKYIESIVKE
jgi:hypothetical protein